MKFLRLIPVAVALVVLLFAMMMSVQATCTPSDTGTAGNDTIDCTIANPPVATVMGLDGDDNIVIGAGVVTGSDVLGDNDFAAGSGNDVIINDGTVSYIAGDSGFGNGSGNDTVVNNGTAYGVYGDSVSGNASGNDVVVNNGIVNNSLYGDGVGGSATGNDTVTNNGYVAGSIYGDNDTGTGTGSDAITNNGTTTNIVAGGGNDVVVNNGTVVGDIDAGDGDDTVVIQAGSAVVGDSIDGGNNYDVLTFQLNSTDPAELEAAAAAIAAANPSGGTITIGGTTYNWVNFEELTQLLNVVRLNGPADPVAVFCAAVGGVDVYSIGSNQGFFELYLSPQLISDGVGRAQEINTDVLIGQTSRVQVYALATGELRVNARGTGFSFSMNSTQCGALPAAQPFTQTLVEEQDDTFVIINRPR